MKFSTYGDIPNNSEVWIYKGLFNSLRKYTCVQKGTDTYLVIMDGNCSDLIALGSSTTGCANVFSTKEEAYEYKIAALKEEIGYTEFKLSERLKANKITTSSEESPGKIFIVDGFFKDDPSQTFEGYLIKEPEDTNGINDEEIFYYGMDEEAIKVNMLGVDNEDFQITKYAIWND